MAELLMECEEEELEPWQQRIKEVEDDDDDDDDDEPIFVREISGSKQINTNNKTGPPQGSFPRIENGTPIRGTAASFPSPGNHFRTPVANTGTQPVTSIYQPVTRPPTISPVVQPLLRPVCSPEPIRRPLTGCLPAHQPPRANPAILQPACRPITVASNSQPASRTVTFPAVAQPALRPVATITAQPVLLNQGYIVNSPQVSSNNSPNVMYGLRPNSTVAQYQGVQTLTTTGSNAPQARPLQPLAQIRPLLAPARTALAAIYRPTAPAQNSLSLGQVHQPLLNSQKTQQATHGQSPSASSIWNDGALIEKRPSPVEVTSISPKKPKTSENGPENRTTAAATSSLKTTPPQVSPVKGTTPTKNGAPFPRACPKCNIHFNLLEPMKRHMKYCCPDKMHHFFLGVTSTEITSSQGQTEEADKGKLIMFVSDFYYGRHTGDIQLAQQEQKTHTTFKCFSCHKILKNNIRFMNHMKHHLELEKQSSESWENHTTCHHCYRQFPTPFQLQCHIETSHTLYESTTICKICELSFESEQVLLQHMKDNHKPGEMPYVCQVCNYRSSTFIDVDRHFRSAHENTKNMLCPFCLKVIKSATPYMQHYMKHQNKGVYRCAKCRLQFLSCKEKMDHKTQHHRTFKKPKQLLGLPPGTKVTIRASVGSLNSTSCPTAAVCTSPNTSPIQIPSKGKTTNTKTFLSSASKSAVHHPKPKPPPQPQPPPPAPKKSVTQTTTKRVKTTNNGLRKLSSVSGLHKCVECQQAVRDFESHFHAYVHCSKCKFSTSCTKAYANHVVSFHGRNGHKRYKTSKKAQKDRRRTTLVCRNCDFLTDVSGLDDMAKHLGDSPTHSCQVITESVSIFSSTLEGDISKSRYESPIGQMQKCQNKSGTCESKITSKSIEENRSTEKIKTPSNTSGNNEAKKNKNSGYLQNRLITSVEQASDSDKISPDNCFTDVGKEELIDVDEEDECSTGQDEVACKEDKLGQTPGNAPVTDNSGHSTPCLEQMEDYKDLSLVSDDSVSFEQFLRRRNEPESVNSDISEQSSVHLEPLTPSEVLEHEATEILQKGTQACSNSEVAEDTKESSTDKMVEDRGQT
ncbi:zinc finger protein 280D [Spea bombifrons]|uniref:zinc finger protein 280D n=1 Tax=Spea bombifrons TaxID=233779 RepID=UPI002349080C|nr:zinc finger protein 280D [Spea bombifrons]